MLLVKFPKEYFVALRELLTCQLLFKCSVRLTVARSLVGSGCYVRGVYISCVTLALVCELYLVPSLVRLIGDSKVLPKHEHDGFSVVCYRCSACSLAEINIVFIYIAACALWSLSSSLGCCFGRCLCRFRFSLVDDYEA